MNRSIKILAALGVALVASPAALATWMSHGSFEPDVREDVQDGWMWENPPEGDSSQVYFNAFGGVSAGLTPAPSPNVNVGAAKTRLSNANEAFRAFLGVWKDCNGDGYIGLAEGALHEYRVELGQHDDTVCPVAQGAHSHNDGTWIRELIAIVHDKTGAPFNATDATNIVDPTAHVWGDTGTPGEDLGTTGSADGCFIRPQPKGTFATVGSFLDTVVECNLDIGDEYNTVVTTVDSGDATGLALADDEEWNEEGHPLNQPLMGRQTTDDRMATVWDCDSTSVDESVSLPVEDPSGQLDQTPGDGEFQLFTVTLPGVAPNLESGDSIFGTVNHTQEGLEDCDTSNDAGPYGFIEGDVTNTNAADDEGKKAATFNFKAWSQQFSPLDADLFGTGPLAPDQGPDTLGLQPLGPAAGTYWTSFTSLVGAAPAVPFRAGVTVDRDTPGDSSADPKLGAGRLYYTFYAYVGSWSTLGLTLPSQGASADYGAEWCDGATEGVRFGFNCDEDAWYLNPDGSRQVADLGAKYLAGPGFDYNLRDIDCFDSGVAEAYGDCASMPLPTPAKDQ